MKKFKAFKSFITFLIGVSLSQEEPIIGYIITLLALYILNFKELNNEIKNFKFKENIKKIYYIYPICFILMIIINYFLIKITGLPQSEQYIRSLIPMKPLYYFTFLIIIAPITEELTFRFGFNRIKNKYVYHIVTSLLYGLLHIESMSQILLIIPYTIFGFSLSLTYKRTNSILYSIITHSLHNLLIFIYIIL